MRHLHALPKPTLGSGAIGRELDREFQIVELIVIPEVQADLRSAGQLQQAAMIFGQAQLTRRAQHALAFYTSQFTQLDAKRFAIVAGGQLSAHQCTWHFDTHTGIGCATNNGQALATTTAFGRIAVIAR